MSYTELPSYPGYTINPRGEVRSPAGIRLTVNSSGQVRVKVNGKISMEYIGDLLADAASANEERRRRVAEARLNKAEKTAREAEKCRNEYAGRLALARRLNALLLAKIGREQPDTDVSGLRIPE